MARKTTAPTQKATRPTRASKAPSTPQKSPTGRQRASRDGAKGKANPFDTIAKMAADGATTADLTAQLQASITAAKDDKTKPVVTKRQAKQVGHGLATERQQAKAKGGKPQSDGKVDAKAKPTSTYKGRPTSNVETIAQRAKESGLRVRASMDVADIAQRLRATDAAVSAWLDSRNGKPAPTAKATTAKAKSTTTTAKPKHEAKAPAKLAVTLRHPWVDREPDYLRGHVLRFTYTVDPNTGHVTSQLHAIEGPDGNVLPDRGRDLPLDFRPAVETLGNGRKVVLRDRTIAGLTAWLQTQGLTEQQ
jgi:hypothetical protein